MSGEANHFSSLDKLLYGLPYSSCCDSTIGVLKNRVTQSIPIVESLAIHTV